MITEEKLDEMFLKYENKEFSFEDIVKPLKNILDELAKVASGIERERLIKITVSLDQNLDYYNDAIGDAEIHLPGADDKLKKTEYTLREIIGKTKFIILDYIKKQTLITAEPEKSGENEVGKKLIKLILEHGTAATKKKTLAVGGGYLFSWDEIPGNDSVRLIEFLKWKIGVNSGETVKIDKIDDGRTINISFENNFISIKLNNEKTKTILTVNEGRISELSVMKENGKLNVYADEPWDIGGGWALTARDIDAKASPRQARLVLSKDGVKKEDKVVAEGNIFTHVESIIGETGIFLFATYVDAVFAGATTDMVMLISAEPKKSKEDEVDKELIKLILEHETTAKPKISGENEVEKELINLIFEETAASKKKTLAVGDICDIGDGWVLTIQSVDAKTSPRQVWLTLSKDGIKKDDKIIAENKIYTYVEKGVIPIFAAYVDAVFAGSTTDAVMLISAEPKKLKDEKTKEELIKLILEHGTDDTERKIVAVGETWDTGGGWALTLQSVDAKTTPRQAWLTLSKDGVEKENIIVAAGKTYKYVESIPGKADVPLFIAFVNAVFAGATMDVVQFSIETRKAKEETTHLNQI